MKNIIFLDIDGVLNCQIHYESKQFFDYMNSQKEIKSNKKLNSLEYYKSQICKERIKLFNNLCNETDSKVVLSSTWRLGKSIKEVQNTFNNCGGTFELIDKTKHSDHGVRGVEIHEWLKENCIKLFNIHYYDFYRYAIIDDDSDMLLNQQNHFFQTDNYSGLTPTTCYKIKRFFTHETF